MANKKVQEGQRVGAIRLTAAQGGGVILPDDDESYADQGFTKEQEAYFRQHGVFAQPEPTGAAKGSDPRKVKVQKPKKKAAEK